MLKLTPKHRFATIRQFQIIQDKKIGCGSFGTVKLARHKNTCRMYALKIINLKDMPSDTQIKLVQRQIKLHSELDHPHIIKLWDTLSDGDDIYMIMQYAERGNLFYHQNTKNIFSQSQAFKFFAQTLQGVTYLHGRDIIHRDLKPENLLLDQFSNIKICDFGWCAEDIKAKRSTFCGTYQYMAPEMLFKSEYDYRVDIWALGILLYEMLHGNAPFKGKTSIQVQQSMLKGSYELGKHLSENAKNLINSILQFQPDKRMSCEEIFKHPWIRDMQSYLNNYLKLQNVIMPADIHSKICTVPPSSPLPRKGDNAKHRKNNSMNIQEKARNININLQINNFAIMGKQGKFKNNYHSQQKQKDIEDLCTNAFDNFNQTAAKKNKMEPVCKTQVSELDIHKIIQKIKTNQSIKTKQKDKDTSYFEKKRETYGDSSSKKKFKMRKSEVDMAIDKYSIRFNTEANQKEQWFDPPKLKKSHLKSKLLINSKSVLRVKGSKLD